MQPKDKLLLTDGPYRIYLLVFTVFDKLADRNPFLPEQFFKNIRKYMFYSYT